MGKGRKKKKHAAPRFVANAAELANRSNAFATEDQNRRARRKAAGCDDSDDESGGEGAGGFMGMAVETRVAWRSCGWRVAMRMTVGLPRRPSRGIAEIIGWRRTMPTQERRRTHFPRRTQRREIFRRQLVARGIFEKEGRSALMKAAAGETAQRKGHGPACRDEEGREEAKRRQGKSGKEAAKEQERLAAEAAQERGMILMMKMTSQEPR